MKKIYSIFCGAVAAVLLTPGMAMASEAIVEHSAEGNHGVGITLLWIAVIILAAKVSSLIEKIHLPSVLGELLIGIALGNLALIGIDTFESIKTNPFIPFLAELGVIFLLFQVGLESNIHEMQKVGMKALSVALVGIIVPFILGTYVVGPWLFPELSVTSHLFLGAALTATSVGITARVFKDLGKLKLPEAQIVLGAAVIDDVIGLVILAIVSAIATIGAVQPLDVGIIIIKAVLFLAGSVFIGQLAAKHLSKQLSKIQQGVGMKFAIIIGFALLFSYAAELIGLAPIVGAFAAGLILDPVYFVPFRKPIVARKLVDFAEQQKGAVRDRLLEIADKHTVHHVEDLIEPLAHFFVPIFFVLTGMNVDLSVLLQPKILLIGLVITAVAFIGKFVSGFAAGKVKKALVGVGMVPRGEVGLIFATIGQSLGVFTNDAFSVIVVMVILTTIMTPPLLTWLLQKE